MSQACIDKSGGPNFFFGRSSQHQRRRSRINTSATIEREIAMPLNLRNGLDRDVYQVIKKLEDANDGKPFTTVYKAYDAIKRSNSSLSRQKKLPLEDAIDRVLRQRKLEQQKDEGSDSEAELDQPEPTKSEDERFLLNRQMTKLWGVESANNTSSSEKPAKKKRRVETDDDERDAARAESVPNGVTDKSQPASIKGDKTPTKKQQKPTRFVIEADTQITPLGGLADVKEELYLEGTLTLRQPEEDDRFRSDKPSGILLNGPTGSGKKSLIKWLASRASVPLIWIENCFDDPERIEKNLTEAFDTALTMAPCIVAIADIDECMGKPGGSTNSDNNKRAISCFKSQMARLKRQGDLSAPVFAMATTSKVTDVDPRALHFGLFERTISIRIPDLKAREEILQLLSEGKSLQPDVDMSELARMTHGFVGADLSRLFKVAHTAALTRWSLLPPVREHLDDYMSNVDTADGDEYELLQSAILNTNTNTPSDFDRRSGADDFKQALKGFVPSLRREGFTVIPSVTWDQVGALTDVRRQLHTSIIGPIKNPDLYRKFGLRRPAGVLLWGPPGCGKTLVAQAVANEAQASFILINGPELLNKYLGESERAVRELFQRARSSTPCILFFDEMDSIAPRRDGASTEAGARVVNALLTELDGAQDRSGIYVIGTTNRPEMIDPAMLRPGRLSVRLLVDLPTPDERVDILTAIFKTCHEEPSDKDLAMLPSIAKDKRCTGFSGADLGGLHTKAAELALVRFQAGETTVPGIHEQDWQQALDQTKRSVEID